MESQQWIQVSLNTENTKQYKKVRGLDVTMYVSPYDVPAAIRGFYDEKKKRFVIQFKYLYDETIEKRTADKYVTLHVGKNSERLYAMEIDVDSLRADEVQVKVAVQNEVEQAFEILLKSPPSEGRFENYQLAKQAVISKQHEVFAAIG